LLLRVTGFAPALVAILFTMAEFKAAIGGFGAGAAVGGGGGLFNGSGAGLGVEEAALGGWAALVGGAT